MSHKMTKADICKILAAVRAAFDAGRDQGSDEATAYEWGCLPAMNPEQAFADFMAEWNPDSAPIRKITEAMK